MEAKVYRALLRIVMSLAHSRRGPRRQFCDPWIFLIYLRSGINDRPVSWASQAINWPQTLLVGAYSKDKDARRGRLAEKQFARGYRIHAIGCG